jgi:ATP-dependent DNA helicase RecQ
MSSRVGREPVFLVDDMVDSRWTFTVLAALLRKAGSGPVYPVALALVNLGRAE